jgi:hypothetical protein
MERALAVSLPTNLDQSLQISSSELQVADTLTYRGITVEFFQDPMGSQIWTYWRNKPIGFGTDNWNYKDDMKAIIDDSLDTITRFDQFQDLAGAKLTWFQNGKYRDIKLTYCGRLLKVFLVADESRINIDQLISDCVNIIQKVGIEEN